MTPDDWARARALFDAAVAREPRERDAFLDEACAGDAALRSEVASLLAAHDRAGDFIERPVFEAAASLLAGDDDAVGRAIGPYIVRHEIGRGGMGVVYLADDTRLSRRVALKTLPPGLGRDPRRRERLRQEARAAAALSHPGIATVYALEEIGDELYLACEHVAGPTLRTLLEAGPIPAAEVLSSALQLARALAAAHAQGVVHRDLKPENVVRTSTGTVKVLDFGIARMESLTGVRLTEGDGPGTPGYMAPEQIRGQDVDFRADLFSFGVLIYELACGSNPFAGATRTAAMARVLELVPPPLSVACRTEASSLDRIVDRCLRKEPAERYHSTEELVTELAHLQSGMIAADSQPLLPRPDDLPPRWWWEFHQAAVSAVYVLMLGPAWLARTWLPQPWGSLFVLATLACAAAAATLRLHLWFTSRFQPAQLSTERAKARRWAPWCDVAMAAVLLTATVEIGADHQAAAMLFVAFAIVAVLASLVIEPATSRATFGG